MAKLSLFKCLIFQLGFLAFLAKVQATSSQCYYPNGDESTDTPCYTDGRITHCCGDSSICLTNQLCLSLNQPFGLSRGSCTDKSWGTSCPAYCKTAQQSAGASLVWYTNGTVTDGEDEYCCNSMVISGNDTLVCSTISGETQTPFTIANGSAIADVAALDGLVKESSSSTSTTVANNTGNSDDTASSNSTCSSGSNNDVAIGAGVGVPLGVIALVALGWALYERHLRKQMLTTDPSGSSPPSGGYSYPPDMAAYSAQPAELGSAFKSGPMPAELHDSTLAR
ncbi:hypothetical protein N7454_006227 [Penicillium verhagenii]|nr:hypothetical protein N7454_006227 [Penicillium verhagenii]